MRSAAAPAATTLIIFTLVFAPVVKHNRVYDALVDKSETRVEVPCQTQVRCLPKAGVVERVTATDASPAAIAAAKARAVAQGIADFLAGRGL